MRKILFSSLILLFATWALPSKAEAVTCPTDGVGDVDYIVNGTNNTSVLSCYSEGAVAGEENNPNSIDEFNDIGVFGGGWDSYCATGDPDPFSNAGDCGTNYSLDVNTDGTWSFTGVAGEEYAIVLKDGNNPGDDSWAAFLLSDPDTSFTGTWQILVGGTPNTGRLSHVTIIDRIVTTSPTTTPDSTDTTPDSTTPGPIVPEPTLLTLLGGGMLLAGRRLRRRK